MKSTPKELKTDEGSQEKIETELRTYFSNRKEVVAAFLFGSHARNQQRSDSDVDVGVLLAAKDIQNTQKFRAVYTVEIGRVLKKEVQPVIMNMAGETLLEQIFANGKCLQINDDKSFATFKTYTYCRIAEFTRYRKMARREFISRLKQEANGD